MVPAAMVTAARFPSMFYRSPLYLPSPSISFFTLSLPSRGAAHSSSAGRSLRRMHASSSPHQPIPEIPSSEHRRSLDGGGGPVDEKLRALRDLFSRPDVLIDAYIIPSQDAHQSEFIADCFTRRAYITGFTGSAGTAVVTKDRAALWTDARYFLQAEKQLSGEWVLMRSGNLGVPTTTEWLNQVLAPRCRIGIDPFLFSSDAAMELSVAISKMNHELVFLYDFNLVDKIWGGSRPTAPKEPIRVHDVKYSGVDILSKLYSLRYKFVEMGCTAIVISMLDEIAWLLNLRGNDVAHSPVFYSYLIVEAHRAKLFVDGAKVTEEVMIYLNNAGVELKPYDSIIQEIESLSAYGAKFWMDPTSVNAAIVGKFKSACARYIERPENVAQSKFSDTASPGLSKYGNGKNEVVSPAVFFMVSPVTLDKAVKNGVELEGMSNAHLRDAAALVEFWAWLEEEIHSCVYLTEVDIADKLLEFRKKQVGFLDTSFDTVCGYGANGAIIHYNPNPNCCSVVDVKNILLLDSGGQYIDGTTDVTRTTHFGEPTFWQKECFTRVLQGHIALDQAVFPEHTPGFVLDVLARSSLWKIGLDYRHGTGHGVGAALNVHEGPQSVSFRFGNMTTLQKGMVISNEPGYYEDHSFGIRIENLLYIKEVDTPNTFGGVRYLGFQKLTFFPIQAKLVQVSLLSPAEINWFNDYHTQIWEKVSPLVKGSARDWLWKNTRSLPTN